MSIVPLSGAAPENSFRLGSALIGASDAELALSVALVVFIILTALLTVFVVLLFAVPKFRALFFKSDDKGNVETKKKRARAASTDAKKRATVKRQTQTEKESSRRLLYSDSVPTVPLDGSTTPTTGDEDMLERTNEAYVALSLGTAAKRSSAAKPKPKSSATGTKPAATAKTASTAKSAAPVKPTPKPTAASDRTSKRK